VKTNPLVRFVLFALAIAYVYQFQWRYMDGKGQYEDDRAWQVLAQEALTRQQSGGPAMRVYYAKQGRGLCNLWDFEAVWGDCVVVKIDVDVKNYRPEYGPIVEQEVASLGNQLHKPCTLISDLALKDEVQVRESIGCGGWRKRFKLHISTHEITVAAGNGTADRTNSWFPKTRANLDSYYFEGEF